MGLINKLYTFVNGPGNLIDATQVNADLDALFTLLSGAPSGGTQGNLDYTNVSNGKWPSRVLAPTVGIQTSTTQLALTTAAQDQAGSSFTVTPAVASNLLVALTADLYWTNDKDQVDRYAYAQLNLDGTLQGEPARIGAWGSSAETWQPKAFGTVGSVYLLSLSAAAHTLKVQGWIDAGGTGTVGQLRRSMVLWALFSS